MAEEKTDGNLLMSVVAAILTVSCAAGLQGGVAPSRAVSLYKEILKELKGDKAST